MQESTVTIAQVWSRYIGLYPDNILKTAVNVNSKMVVLFDDMSIGVQYKHGRYPISAEHLCMMQARNHYVLKQQAKTGLFYKVLRRFFPLEPMNEKFVADLDEMIAALGPLPWDDEELA